MTPSLTGSQPASLAPNLTRPRPKQKMVGAGKQRPLRIIEGASGVLRPGVFTLVLAPPGSGKTTLLRALSGCAGVAEGSSRRMLWGLVCAVESLLLACG